MCKAEQELELEVKRLLELAEKVDGRKPELGSAGMSYRRLAQQPLQDSSSEG